MPLSDSSSYWTAAALFGRGLKMIGWLRPRRFTCKLRDPLWCNGLFNVLHRSSQKKAMGAAGMKRRKYDCRPAVRRNWSRHSGIGFALTMHQEQMIGSKENIPTFTYRQYLITYFIALLCSNLIGSIVAINLSFPNPSGIFWRMSNNKISLTLSLRNRGSLTVSSSDISRTGEPDQYSKL